jgi:hypothetical protein
MVQFNDILATEPARPPSLDISRLEDPCHGQIVAQEFGDFRSHRMRGLAPEPLDGHRPTMAARPHGTRSKSGQTPRGLSPR